VDTSLTWLDRLVNTPGHPEWQRLADVYAPLIGRWIARAGIQGTDQDDLVQEVLMVVVRRVSEFEHQHTGAFRGWLRAILANQLRKYYARHTGIRCPISLDDMTIAESQLARMHDREHDEHFAVRAMQSVRCDFSDTTWRAFQMQVFENLSPAEVAAELNISLNAVIKAKSRVLKRLRMALQTIVQPS
jgi:RNA polymerase sigma-70 factor, ECF subfamily